MESLQLTFLQIEFFSCSEELDYHKIEELESETELPQVVISDVLAKRLKGREVHLTTPQ